MKIAYLILAHRYPEQLVRLVNRLDHPSATFLIHLDKKMDADKSTCIKKALGNKANVLFIKRHTCHWAGFGIVSATIQGIKEALEANIQFDYLALLSGQDYPIKTNEFILDFLRQRQGTSFIHINPFPYQEWTRHDGGWSRVKKWHFRNEKYNIIYPQKDMLRTPVLNRVWNVIVSLFPLERKFPRDYHPYGGAQFWCLHKSHVQRIFNFMEANPRFVRFFRYVYVPDEIFFHTIVGNLVDKEQICSDTLHFLEWHRPGAVLTSSDFTALKETYYLFARKFDNTVDPAVLDRIDKELLQIRVNAVSE